MAFSNFPYTDFHNLNLDWILETTKNLDKEWNLYHTDWEQWKNEVTHYVYNLDYYGAVTDYMNNLKSTGELSDIVNSWLGADYGIVCIGDSYGQGYVPDGNKKVTSWIELFKSKYFKTQTLYSRADGGAGFAATGQGNLTFSGMLSALTDTISESNRKKVKYVVVAGGWNDIKFSADSINTGISNFVQIATGAYPNAEICIGFIAAPSANALTTTENWEGWKTAKTAYETTWTNYRVLVGANIGLRWNGLLASDFIHPNATGQSSVADSLYKSIIGGIYEGNRFDNNFAVGNPNWVGSFNYNKVSLQYNNNTFDLRFGTRDKSQIFAITFLSPLDTLDSTTTLLGTINIDFLPESAECMCPCIIHDSTGYHNAFCVVYLNPIDGETKHFNEIWMKVVSVTPDAFVSYVGVKSIQFYGLRFTGLLY